MLLLGEITLLVLLPLVLGLGIIGSGFKWLIRAIFARSLDPPSLLFPDLPGRLALDFALGTTVVPLFYLLVTAVGGRISQWVAVGILVAFVALLAFRVARRYRGLGPRILVKLEAVRWEVAALAAVVVGALALRIWAYWNLYVYAGDDIRFYTVITELITSGGRLPNSFGPFGDPSWTVTTDNHLFFSGIEATYAFVGSWLPLNAPQLVSAGTLIYGTAIPVSVYLLVRTLFPQRSRWLPFFSALTVAIVASYPLFMTQWGGIDETIAWFLAPLILAVLLVAREGTPWNPPLLVVEGVLIGGLGLITPLGLFYLLAFLLPLFAEIALRRAGFRRSLESIGGAVALGLVFLSPAIVLASLNALETGGRLVPGSLGWLTFASAPLIQPGDPSGNLARLLTLSTGWEFSAFVVIVGFAGLLYGVRTRWVPTLLGWMGVLFLLNENGPYGLYWVQFPGWDDLYPDRTAHLLFLPLSIGVGFVLASLMDGIFRKGSIAWDPPRVAWSRLRARPPNRGAIATVLCAVGVAAVLVASGIVTYETAEINNRTVVFETAFTPEDLAGMQWLRAHAPAGSTVLINEADAGSWIPAMTGLRAYPFIELINNATVLELYANMTEQLPRGNLTMFSYLTAAYNLSYVYFGEHWAGGLVSPILPDEFTTGPPAWDFVTAASLCRAPVSNRSVDLYCVGDSVTFRGPVVLHVVVGAGPHPAENYTVPIPENTVLRYTVPEPTNPSPVVPVNITVEAPAGLVFADGDVEILQINPGYNQIVLERPPFNETSPA